MPLHHVNLKLPKLHQSIVKHDARFQVLNAGRRFGKTLLIVGKIYKHLQKEFRNRQSGQVLPHRINYYAPTFGQARSIAWERLKEGLEPITKGKPNESLMEIKLVNGGLVKLFGTWSSDTVRGTYCTLAILDEFAFHKPGTWVSVIRPMLADVDGEAFFCSSPDGKGEFYKHYLKGQDPSEPEWHSWTYTTIDGGFVLPEEVEAARRDMDESTWRQEFFAEFVGHAGRVCKSYKPEVNLANVKYDPTKRIWLSCDFNVDPMCWVLAHRINGEYHFVKEFALRNTNTAESVEHLADWLDSKRHKGGIVVTGDASGNARKTNSSRPQDTDYVIIQNTLARRGFNAVTMDLNRANPSINARILAFNSALCSADGFVKIRINPTECPRLVYNIDELKYDEGKNKIWVPTPSDIKRDENLRYLGHMFDAASYLIDKYDPVKRDEALVRKQYEIVTRYD